MERPKVAEEELSPTSALTDLKEEGLLSQAADSPDPFSANGGAARQEVEATCFDGLRTSSLSSPKVLIILDTTRIGGPGKGILQLLSYKKHEDFSAVLVSFTYTKPKPTDFIDEVRKCGYTLETIHHHHQLDPLPILHVWRLFRQHKCDLIETHGYKGHVIAWVLSRLCKIPWLAFEHGLTFDSWRMRLYNRINYWLLRKADIAVGVSPLILETLRQLRPGKPSHLLLNSVEPAPLQPVTVRSEIRKQWGIPDGGLLCGVFGRLSAEKGQLVLIEAIGAITDKISDIYFLLAGDGPDQETAKLKVAQLGLSERVIFAGFQTNINPLYQAIDCLVLPSLSEGLPNVVLEAMANSKPVLATRVGAIPEVIDEEITGWICAPGDAAALANALQRMYQKRHSLEAMGIKASAVVAERFSPQERVAACARIYRSLLKQATKPLES